MASLAARGWKFDSSSCITSVPSLRTSGLHFVIRLTEAMATALPGCAVRMRACAMPAMRLAAPACHQARLEVCSCSSARATRCRSVTSQPCAMGPAIALAPVTVRTIRLTIGKRRLMIPKHSRDARDIVRSRRGPLQAPSRQSSSRASLHRQLTCSLDPTADRPAPAASPVQQPLARCQQLPASQ